MIEKLRVFLHKNALACEILLAFVMTVGVMYFAGLTKTKEYFLAVVVFVASLALVKAGMRRVNKRRIKFALWYAVPFSMAFWLGHKVHNQSTAIEGISIVDLPMTIVVMVIVALMVVCVLAFMDEHQFTPKKKVLKNSWLKYAAIILVCWMPLFLVFFPGIVSSDSAVQIRQAIGEGAWSNWHPVLHTAFVALPTTIGFNMFGDLTAGIALSTIVQMIVLSAIFGYVASWVVKRTSKKWLGYVFVAFLGLCPVVACYAITMWKDVLFSAVFMLMVIKIYDLLNEKNRNQKLGWKDLWCVFALVFLAAFLRNGGVLIVLALGVALIIYYKSARKILAILTAACLAGVLIIQGPIYGAIGIAKSPFMESMSVPVQQMGYVASMGELNEEEEEALKKYADVEKLGMNYSPMNADPAKNSFDYVAVEDDKIGFIKTWLMILGNHFGGYVKAYMLQTYAYWYVQSDVWVLDFGHVHDEIWLKEEYSDKSLLGDSMKTLAEKVEGGLLGTSWFGWMANVGVLCWGIVLMVIVFIYQKRYMMMVPMACVLIYIVSLLVASPVSWIFRYVYSLLLIMPILIVVSFIKLEKGKIK